MCELLFILQCISVTNIILSNNVYDKVLSVCCCALFNFESFIHGHLFSVFLGCFFFFFKCFYFADRAHLCWRTLNAPNPHPTLPAHPEGIIVVFVLIILTTTASQVPELLCQSTDWINLKFYEICGHLKWFSPCQISVRSKSVSARSPYIRFEGVVELCSRLWLVVAVRQRDKRKGSILSPLLRGHEPGRFRSRVQYSNHWSISRPRHADVQFSKTVHLSATVHSVYQVMCMAQIVALLHFYAAVFYIYWLLEIQIEKIHPFVSRETSPGRP